MVHEQEIACNEVRQFRQAPNRLSLKHDTDLNAHPAGLERQNAVDRFVKGAVGLDRMVMYVRKVCVNGNAHHEIVMVTCPPLVLRS